MKKTFKHSKFTAIFTDENGYFSLTGDCDGGSGAIGYRIAEIDDRFKLLADMHLSSCETGEPMHSWSNAEYFYKNNKIDTLKNHLHVEDALFKKYLQALVAITQEEINVIPNPEIEMDDLKAELENVMEDIKDAWQEQAQAVYDLVDEIESNLVGKFVYPLDGTNEYISEDYENHLSSYDQDEQDKIIALAKHEDVDVLEVDQKCDRNTYSVAGRDYLVVTDEEGDELWDQDLENYIDECLEIPESVKSYFDREAWKADARIDGRAHSLARWDGNEYTEEINNETYYIYRQ